MLAATQWTSSAHILLSQLETHQFWDTKFQFLFIFCLDFFRQFARSTTTVCSIATMCLHFAGIMLIFISFRSVSLFLLAQWIYILAISHQFGLVGWLPHSGRKCNFSDSICVMTSTRCAIGGKIQHEMTQIPPRPQSERTPASNRLLNKFKQLFKCRIVYNANARQVYSKKKKILCSTFR